MQSASACQKSLFDKLVDGGVSPPPLPPLQRTGTSAKRSFRQRRLGIQRIQAGWSRLLQRRDCYTVFAEIFQISGRKNCRETIFALENGIFRRKNRPDPAVHAAGVD